MESRVVPTPSSVARVKPVHVAVNGRVRFHVPGLKRAEGMKQFLVRRLMDDEAVRDISASTVTGNVLISYNSDNTHQDMGVRIQEILQELQVPNAPRPEPGPPRTAHRAPVNAQPVAEPEAKPAARRPPAVSPSGLVIPLPEGTHWHQLDRTGVLDILESDLDAGLPAGDIKRRMELYGMNRLPETAARSGWQIFWEQMWSLPTALLGAAAGVSILTGGIFDAAVIMGVVVANAVIGYMTESEAEKTILSLKKLVRPSAEIIRDGAVQCIPVEQVVVGDILVLKPGAYVAADSRILKASHLSVDESMLTGESMPVVKRARRLTREQVPLGDRTNMVHMGTLVTGGQGLAVVVATGRNTEIGTLQLMLQETSAPKTPIERQLGQMGDQLVILCCSICGVVFFMGFLRGYGVFQMLRSAISLAAAAVPEGLPAAATINFALGITNLRKHRVLVRHLQAVETLGAVQTICLDKTGTITRNRMTVRQVAAGRRRFTCRNGTFVEDGQPIDIAELAEMEELLNACALCNETRVNGRNGEGELDLTGSSTENALVELAALAGMDVAALKKDYPLRKVNHRSESRLFMSTLHRTPDGRKVMFIKGSPPEVLNLCDRMQIGGRAVTLEESDRLAIETENERMAGSSLRVLGFAVKEITAEADGQCENAMMWLGLVGMSDPIRDGARELIEVFHRAGVETVMITGDQSSTAYAVATELGLSRSDPLEILDSTELGSLDPEALRALATTAHVYSRVSPAHKLQIVQALQAAGRIVAMTGDGINDGPALKAADVGIAMGRSGTDVARDVADIVLEEDNLEILTLALRDGRTTYGNIRKSVDFFLSTNLSEIMLMFTAMGLGIGFPLNVMQLLWINIISDIFPGLALSMEASEPDVMDHPPRDAQAPLFSRKDMGRMAFNSATITGGALAAYGYGVSRYGMGIRATSLAFQSLTIGQLLHAISCRSERTGLFTRKKLPPNRYLNLALGGSLALQALTVVVPPLRGILGLAVPTLSDLLVIAGTALMPLLLTETKKASREGNDD